MTSQSQQFVAIQKLFRFCALQLNLELLLKAHNLLLVQLALFGNQILHLLIQLCQPLHLLLALLVIVPFLLQVALQHADLFFERSKIIH